MAWHQWTTSVCSAYKYTYSNSTSAAARLLVLGQSGTSRHNRNMSMVEGVRRRATLLAAPHGWRRRRTPLIPGRAEREAQPPDRH
eukprot:4390777-Pleurochrysis_carterae.AAC.1